MYSGLVNVQIILSLLKQHNIRNLVLSPGSRHFQLVRSVETDDFFRCYSVVDERSAAYFALGLSEALDEPVCVCCTSSTATCNYLPAVQEAFERHVQLLVLTGDRDYRRLYQMEDQMINQNNMYSDYVRYSTSLPVVRNSDDIWFCERTVNEAILELNHHEKGPAHINFQLMDISKVFVDTLTQYRKISRIDKEELYANKESIQEQLNTKKRILVLCGEYYSQNSELKVSLEHFFEKYNAVISCDYFSNMGSDIFLKTVMITESIDFDEFDEYVPDLVITIGHHVWSFIKYWLQESKRNFEHWRIANDGAVIDGFKRLTYIFECNPQEFFICVNENTETKNDKIFYHYWLRRLNKVKLPDLKYTNFYAISYLCKNIPSGSMVHLSILNSVRLANFSNMTNAVNCFSNLGADGIDGCLSTFLGQSSLCKNQLAFLIIGDLSFLYDLNATLYEFEPHQRILLINNFSGSEFHTNFGAKYENKQDVDNYIAAGHTTKIYDWVSMTNVMYLQATDRKSLEKGMELFLAPSSKAIIFEVLTNADEDTSVLKQFYSMNRKRNMKIMLKKIIRKSKSLFKL